jgi:hypothetical protein
VLIHLAERELHIVLGLCKRDDKAHSPTDADG